MSPSHHPFRIGLIKGGQLARMLIEAMEPFDVNPVVLDAPNSPAGTFSHESKDGDSMDFDTVYAFGKTVDAVLLEFEHVNADALEALEKEGKPVFPSSAVLRIIQDKGLQKLKLKELGIPTADFHLVQNRAALKALSLAFPFVQKSRTMGYDGQGVKVIKTAAELEEAFDSPSMIEGFVSFEKEIAIVLARNSVGEVAVYDAVEMDFDSRRNILRTLRAPAQIASATAEEATQIAKKLIEALDYVGVMAVEMFVLKDGHILVNEIAPRVHNSGHHTIEANVTSQYEQCLRTVLGLPLGSTERKSYAVMVNLYGEEGYHGTPVYSGLDEVMKKEGIFVHLYGKIETRPFRKMGHVTVLGKTLDEAKHSAEFVLKTLKVIS